MDKLRESAMAALEARDELSQVLLEAIGTGGWIPTPLQQSFRLALADEVRSAEALRAALAEQAPQWQPIETAPKDGTYVLVVPPTHSSVSCSVARFDNDRYSRKPRPFWNRSDGWGRVSVSRDTPPTHWMPLPKPPEGAAP